MLNALKIGGGAYVKLSLHYVKSSSEGIVKTILY